MTAGPYKYIWRCAKCANHLVNISQMDGMIKQEKKCPKCKSINILTLANGELFIHCQFYNPRLQNYSDEIPDNYSYQEQE
jgi:phage FluMu protein Com